MQCRYFLSEHIDIYLTDINVSIFLAFLNCVNMFMYIEFDKKI